MKKLNLQLYIHKFIFIISKMEKKKKRTIEEDEKKGRNTVNKRHE